MPKRDRSVTKNDGRRRRAAGQDPLEALIVIDRLEVGPVRLEARRLTAQYRVVQGGRVDSADLIYRYEEDVFEPGDEASLNLACMCAAQVAMNYGLFCKSIVFHGPFDETDRRFIRDMTENTSREIYVKKLLEPNPFIEGDAAGLPAEKRKRFTNATLEFPDAASTGRGVTWKLWETDRNKHAILSSGGKDSLLTYGLLSELGGDVHPVFVNESGRHWFTALNAYRHFKKNVPNTARVWVNSDRLFAWMLRRLPLVRKDFSSIRSDDYPIRLWTVAVFLFGVLPLARTREIGRILIGDEFDSTQRASFGPISHYNGYFDQSRHFDNALSRYYMRKGWGASQFSVLRPLSELLIEKVLVERYPGLQEHQVSCHATHTEGERVRPCGKCEKCRRIVGMLTAIGADPERCGYSGEQVKDCLGALAGEDLHQESAAVQQLLFMLAGRRVIELTDAKKRSLKERPEILKLRFDGAHSPKNGIPADLRRPLFGIMLEHASGAVQRIGREWRGFDPLADPEMLRPFAFEPGAGGGRAPTGGKEGHPVKGYMWGEMTWPEAEERFKKLDIALLPVGSIEQHGPHLPLDTDGFDAYYLAKRIAEACSDPKPFVLSLVPYGVSYEHDEFKGTVSISNDTLSHLVYEIGMSVARNGINKIVIINGHGGNTPALSYAAQMITRDARIFVCVDTGETSDVDIYKLTDTPNDIHAGEIETSTALAVRPDLVRLDKAVKSVPRFSSRYLDFTSKRVVNWYVYTKRLSKSGVIGDPTKASVEKGERLWQVMIAHLVALVEDLKGITLEEIYQKRY